MVRRHTQVIPSTDGTMIIDSPLGLVFRDLFYRVPAFAGPHDVFLKLEGVQHNRPDQDQDCDGAS